jgi:Skp family chaperone for outer membrane proteins
MKKATKEIKVIDRNLPAELEGIDAKDEEKKLKAELKSIADKVDTVKRLKRAAAHEAWKLKQKAKREALKLEKQKAPEVVEPNIDTVVKQVESLAADIYCLLKVVRDGGSVLKVIRKDKVWYLVSQSKNVFGTNTDIISEHADSGLAAQALAKHLLQTIKDLK